MIPSRYGLHVFFTCIYSPCIYTVFTCIYSPSFPDTCISGTDSSVTHASVTDNSRKEPCGGQSPTLVVTRRQHASVSLEQLGRRGKWRRGWRGGGRGRRRCRWDWRWGAQPHQRNQLVGAGRLSSWCRAIQPRFESHRQVNLHALGNVWLATGQDQWGHYQGQPSPLCKVHPSHHMGRWVEGARQPQSVELRLRP